MAQKENPIQPPLTPGSAEQSKVAPKNPDMDQQEEGEGSPKYLRQGTRVEAVEHPAHYNSGRIEVIDFIEDQELGFSLGNAVKYIARAGRKNGADRGTEDLQKAIWYLQRELSLRDGTLVTRTELWYRDED